MSTHLVFSILFGVIGANIAVLAFNAIGMGIMVSQMDDFLAHKRDELYGPPSWQTYVTGWGLCVVVFTLMIYWVRQ